MNADDIGAGSLDWAERTVGPCRSVADRSWRHGDSHVLRLRDADGTTWYVKRHRYADRYRREVAAYQDWVPALGRRAPRLRDHDDDLRVLLLSSVPGEPGTEDWLTPDVQHQAGTLLRLLHDVAPPRPWPDFAEYRIGRFEQWATGAAGLVEPRALDFVRGEVRGLAGLPAPVRVPCHLDYGPRNWIVTAGTLHVIDFEWARPHCWVHDLGRLYFDAWQTRPDARDAFLDGYGRSLTADDLAVLLVLGASSAVSTIVWARQHGDTAFEAQGRRNLATLMAGTCR